MVPNNKTIIIFCIGFAVVHLVWFLTDYHPVKERFISYARANFSYIYVLQAVIVTVTLLQSVLLPLPKTVVDRYVVFLGVFVHIAGVIIAVWAKLTMGNVWGYPGQLDTKRQSQLITHGIFTISRNPIYLGILLFITGYCVGIRSPLIVLNIFLYRFIRQAVETEEQLLKACFGKEYLAYKKRVPRFI